MQRDWRAFLVPLREIVPLQNARDCVERAEPDRIFEAQLAEPVAVEADLGFFGVQNLENLRLVSLGVRVDLLACQRSPGKIAAGWIADEPSHVADQKNHAMPEHLEMFHLPKKHRVAQMQVRRGRIEARLHPQRTSEFQPLSQVLLADDFGGPLLQKLNWSHK